MNLLLGITPPNEGEGRAIRLGCPTYESPAVGWDFMREELWVPRAHFIPRGTQRLPPAGAEGLFVAQEERILRYLAGFPVIELISIGLADGKPAKWSSSAAVAEDLQLLNMTYYSPSTIWRQTYPRVTKLWIAHQPPDLLAHCGVPSVPEETFGQPRTPWSLYPAGGIAWNASGWVGESRNNDVLPGAQLTLVVDTWLYDPGYLDRNETTLVEF